MLVTWASEWVSDGNNSFLPSRAGENGLKSSLCLNGAEYNQDISLSKSGSDGSFWIALEFKKGIMLDSLHIISNSKFVEIYKKSVSESDEKEEFGFANYDYLSTLKTYPVKSDDGKIMFVVERQLSAVTLFGIKFKFLSLKGRKSFLEIQKLNIILHGDPNSANVRSFLDSLSTNYSSNNSLCAAAGVNDFEGDIEGAKGNDPKITTTIQNTDSFMSNVSISPSTKTSSSLEPSNYPANTIIHTNDDMDMKLIRLVDNYVIPKVTAALKEHVDTRIDEVIARVALLEGLAMKAMNDKLYGHKT